MSEIVFNPDEMNYGGAERGQSIGGLTRFFMRVTGVQDQKTVNKIMLGVAVVFFIISAVIIFKYL